jgi:kynureninase
MSEFRLEAEFARELDAADPLRHVRDRFYTRPDRIYLDGNSLGLASREAERELLAALDEWKSLAIDGWTEAEQPWFHIAEELGAAQASMMGAHPDEVVANGTTTTNLHALVASFYHPSGLRRRILGAALDFPSDLYALASQARLLGGDLRLVPSGDGRTVDEDDVIAAMTDDVALVVLSSVLYRSGQLLDIRRLARAAHERGIPIGFDCSHSAGALPHSLHEWGVDFAFWCGYKYLNGGPGALGAYFVHRRHHGATPALAGWWGNDKASQFDMATTFRPAAGAGAWQWSTPSILAAAPLRGALRIMNEVGIGPIRERSLRLTGYLMRLVDGLLTDAAYGFRMGTPREDHRRGGHVAVEHPEAVRICKALKARGVVPDYRPPNVIRLAPIALYTTFEEVWNTAQILREIIDTGAHLAYPAERGEVA